MHIYDVVDEFECCVAEYAGAPYGVAVDSCTNAIKLCLVYDKMLDGWDVIEMPKRTYVGVPYAVLALGGKCSFRDEEWVGEYKFYSHENDVFLGCANIVDSARRFHKGMYKGYDELRCLSFHETKHLPIGRGGMILTDNEDTYHYLRKMRFDGRTPKTAANKDKFITPGFHCHMKPDDAARGLMLMAGMPDDNEDLPNSPYPDLSQFPIFQEGYSWM